MLRRDRFEGLLTLSRLQLVERIGPLDESVKLLLLVTLLPHFYLFYSRRLLLIYLLQTCLELLITSLLSLQYALKGLADAQSFLVQVALLLRDVLALGGGRPLVQLARLLLMLFTQG